MYAMKIILLMNLRLDVSNNIIISICDVRCFVTTNYCNMFVFNVNASFCCVILGIEILDVFMSVTNILMIFL